MDRKPLQPTLRGMKPAMAPSLIDVVQLAEMLGCSTRHVRRLSDMGKCPSPIRLGKVVRWPIEAIETWIIEGCPNCRKRPGVDR